MSADGKYHFRLYVAGDSPNSVLARDSLRAFCWRHLPGRHTIEIVDVLADPERALADNVLVTPTLVKLAPPPMRKIIGNLSNEPKLLQGCDLAPPPP